MSNTPDSDPRDVLTGALSVLVSDSLNGITPNDRRLVERLTALGVSRAALESELAQARQYFAWRAARLLEAVGAL